MAQPEPVSTEQLDLAEAGAGLRTRLDELRSREAELKKPPERGASISFGKRIGDGTSEAIGRITEVGVADSLDAIEARIVRALEKLGEDTYGICDVCGEDIPVPRLRIAPESNLCVRDAATPRRQVSGRVCPGRARVSLKWHQPKEYDGTWASLTRSPAAPSRP